MSAWLIFLVFGALVIAVAIYGYYQAEQRKKELAEWGAGLGLRFDASKDYSLDQRYHEFDCLLQGSARYGFNHLRGSYRDWPLHAFDYHYETYSTDSKGRRTTHHHYFSALVLLVDLPLRPLSIRPEGFFDKVAAFFGVEDINFESDEFSRTFHVKSPDRQWAYDVLHQATMEFLLHAPRFHVELGIRRAIAFRQSRFSVPDFHAALDLLEGILDRLPNYLLRELKESER